MPNNMTRPQVLLLVALLILLISAGAACAWQSPVPTYPPQVPSYPSPVQSMHQARPIDLGFRANPFVEDAPEMWPHAYSRAVYAAPQPVTWWVNPMPQPGLARPDPWLGLPSHVRTIDPYGSVQLDWASRDPPDPLHAYHPTIYRGPWSWQASPTWPGR